MLHLYLKTRKPREQRTVAVIEVRMTGYGCLVTSFPHLQRQSSCNVRGYHCSPVKQILKTFYENVAEFVEKCHDSCLCVFCLTGSCLSES